MFAVIETILLNSTRKQQIQDALLHENIHRWFDFENFFFVLWIKQGNENREHIILQNKNYIYI